jgi:hypothetical protein
MVFDVMLGGFDAMMLRVMAMTGGGVGMMRGDLVIVILIMPGGFAMMARGAFVMIGGIVMMFAGGMLVRHGKSPFRTAPGWPRPRH